MEDKIFGCLIIIVMLGINNILEGINNISLKKIIKEQKELIDDQQKLIEKQKLIIKLTEQNKEKRTKFNINDKVWFISCIGNIYNGNIEAIIKQENKEKEIKIMYLFTNYGWVNEQDCFATKKQAQKEYNKKNNENNITK